MTFDLNLYSGPLLFAFLQGWIYAVLFWIRAWKNERLSDTLFGILLVFLTFEIWEYLLGFAGVEFLWQELDFFPRNFSLLVPVTAWLYLQSQLDRGFRLQFRHLYHLIPFAIYVVYHLTVYSVGAEFVDNWKSGIHYRYGIAIGEIILNVAIQVIYYYKAYRLYRDYRLWVKGQRSDTDSISFRWFRNFLLVFLTGMITGWTMTMIDTWLHLDFWHDWWDELANAGLIYYLSISGFHQTQPKKLFFNPTSQKPEQKVSRFSDSEVTAWRQRIEEVMHRHKPYLQADLTLSSLANLLGTNTSQLSAVINSIFTQNFNDFINAYRIRAVIAILRDPHYAHLSLLGKAMECGFNSKATFNRAFKKVTGYTPSTYVHPEG